MVDVKELVATGRSLIENGKYEKALEIFEKALILDSENPELWNEKGVALRSLGRYEEAVECYTKSLELDPKDKDAS